MLRPPLLQACTSASSSRAPQRTVRCSAQRHNARSAQQHVSRQRQVLVRCRPPEDQGQPAPVSILVNNEASPSAEAAPIDSTGPTDAASSGDGLPATVFPEPTPAGTAVYVDCLEQFDNLYLDNTGRTALLSESSSSKYHPAPVLAPENINPALRVLLVSSAFNGMTQRTKVWLEQQGHFVSVQLFTSVEDVELAAQLFKPHVIICPFLKDFVPSSIYERHTCLVVHPGLMGDKGPSSLDWAITEGKERWGVTVLQAAEKADGGPVWASVSFNMPTDDVSTKSNIYNTLVADAALEAISNAVRQCQLIKKQVGYVPLKFECPVLPQLINGDAQEPDAAMASCNIPETLPAAVKAIGTIWSTGHALAFQLAGQSQEYGHTRPLMPQASRRIDWLVDTTDVVVRKIRAADGQPGVRDEIMGLPVYLCGATHEDTLKGRPKEILATRHGGVCLGTVDGAVWVSHLRRAKTKTCPTAYFKLPAVMVLGQEALAAAGVQEVPVHVDVTGQEHIRTFRDIWYEEWGPVGILHFPFYNGAASTEQLKRLHGAFSYAKSKSNTSVIILAGGRYCWNNGIHLNVIEASSDPGHEAWLNINAIDDVVRDIITCDTHITVSAVQGNAGAGGVYLAMAADYVVAHEGVVLNPHYKAMGLFGSEYWTYLSGRRLSPAMAAAVSDACLPLVALQAWQLGMIDEVVAGARSQTLDMAVARAHAFARPDHFDNLLTIKKDRRARDEGVRPLESYRQEELAHMRDNMINNNWGFHEKRQAFVHKKKPTATCARIALHSVDGNN